MTTESKKKQPKNGVDHKRWMQGDHEVDGPTGALYLGASAALLTGLLLVVAEDGLAGQFGIVLINIALTVFVINLLEQHRFRLCRSSRFVPTPMAGPSVASAGSCSRGIVSCVLAACVLLMAPASALSSCEVEAEVVDIWSDESVLNAEVRLRPVGFGDDEDGMLVVGNMFFHYEKEGGDRLLKISVPLRRVTGTGLTSYDGGFSHNVSYDSYGYLRFVKGGGTEAILIYSVIPRGCDDKECIVDKVTIEGLVASCD